MSKCTEENKVAGSRNVYYYLTGKEKSSWLFALFSAELH